MAMPQTQRPDANGDDAVGARLTELGGERVVVLHDRWTAAGRQTIGHLAITPRGAFVIDVRQHSGTLERRRFGSIIRSEVRLYVGGCDRTALLRGVEDQVDLVRDALGGAGFSDAPVRGVLCIVGADWGVYDSPFKLGDVLVTYPEFLYRLLGKDARVATSTIQDAARALAIALPSA